MMKKLHCLIAGTAMIVAGCGDEEATLSAENTARSASQESAELVSSSAEMPGETVDQAVITDIVAAEAANGTTAESVEPVAEALDTASQGASDVAAGAVATAATATAEKLQGKTPAAIPGPAADGMANVDLTLGKDIYVRSCFACHGTGAAGAPKLGDEKSWTPRIAQGMEVMVGHAINGFRGSSGYMPAKGGASTLTDEEVTAAVAYMVSIIKMASARR